MIRRMLAGLLLGAMAVTAVMVITPSQASAEGTCAAAPANPQILKADAFAGGSFPPPDPPGDYLTGQDLLDYYGGDTAAVIAWTELFAGTTGVAADFMTNVNAWLSYVEPAPGACDTAVEAVSVRIEPYPGPFTVMPDPVTAPYGFGSVPNPVASPPASPTPDASGGTGGGYELAHTGFEVGGAMVGLGLLGWGAAVMGVRRRID